MTLYQQKWVSKQETRSYHGEEVNEGRWQTLFQHKLEGVAQLDASLKGNVPPTPMVLQTFAPLEKRLDVAVFRAMFASSVRQSRSFILSGHVKVNGVTINHPGFTLKPGDVFAVDPERVLEALGKRKPNLKEAYRVDKFQVIQWQKFVQKAKDDPRGAWQKQKDKHRKQKTLYENKFVPELSDKDSTDVNERLDNMQELKLKKMKEVQHSVSRKSILNDIYRTAKKLVDESKDVSSSAFDSQFGKELSGKCFQVYELLENENKTMELEPEKAKEELGKIVPTYKEGKPVGEFYDDSRSKKLRQLLSELNTKYLDKIRDDFTNKPLSEDEIIKMWSTSLKKHSKLPELSEATEKGSYYLNLPWQHGMYGLKDASKPYFTPWSPRAFLSPFAILPKHIEISFLTCHAVYLRDPVARPGESEVISPFDEDIHERAYMYYVKNGM
ncbi:DEKNAAC100532 [Brettanomyces naardenensis]|uniref:Small ribosomal subunit protein uS4m n=1 Tax=Brettanomyces naardenensis TaxID=13370 RepID=A0A448YGQ7_BRENA|nr:DEKNAAC100532 [Brettanomyces naardenensis]